MSSRTASWRVSRGRLWFGLLGGAGAWTVHLMAAYLIAEFGCVGWPAAPHLAGISIIAWLEIALTAATAITAGAATLVAYRSYQRLEPSEAPQTLTATSERHTAWAGLLTSGVFTVVILFESIPIVYYLQRC